MPAVGVRKKRGDFRSGVGRPLLLMLPLTENPSYAIAMKVVMSARTKIRPPCSWAQLTVDVWRDTVVPSLISELQRLGTRRMDHRCVVIPVADHTSHGSLYQSVASLQNEIATKYR